MGAMAGSQAYTPLKWGLMVGSPTPKNRVIEPSLRGFKINT